MSSRARLATFGVGMIVLAGGVVAQSFGSVANGIPVGGGSSGSLSPHLIDPGTTASASPSPTPWSTTSTIAVTTSSSGAITYAVDPATTAPGCAASPSGASTASVSATGVGNCVIDVNVAADTVYNASSTSATVNFTAAPATTSATASPASTPWSNTSAIDVTTNSSGSVTYALDPSSTAAGCAVNASGTVSATGAGACVVDVSVAGDSNYLASTASATVTFTLAPATTTALASPASTTWLHDSSIEVTSNSTGPVTYSVDPSSTAGGCAVDPSGTASATGAGSCFIDVHVAADSRYAASTASATVTFTAPAGGGGGGGSSGLTQTSPTTGSVTTADSGAFTAGPITVTGNSGTVTFVVTQPSASLSVNSTGLISTTGALTGGTYSVSGTDSDAQGLTGTWTYSLKVSATVTFSANGGSGTMATESASAPTALMLNTFVRKGFTFIGWNTSPTASGVSYVNGALFPFTSTTVLFARWKRGALPLRTVTFEANGGTGHTASEVENAPAAIAANHFTRHGYDFVDWSTTARGAGRSIKPGATYAFKRSMTLYARWKKAAVKAPKPPKPPTAPKAPAHVVTFFANGGAGKMSKEVKRTTSRLTSLGFRRSGYTFTGWNTKPDGNGAAYANASSYAFKTSMNLYAQWKKDIPVPQPIAGGIILSRFAPGSATLTTALETQIKHLATEAKSQGSKQIVLFGCGDEVGSSSSSNVTLARQRAGAVATYLGKRLAQVGLKNWSISVTTTSPSPGEVGSVVATLGS